MPQGNDTHGADRLAAALATFNVAAAERREADPLHTAFAWAERIRSQLDLGDRADGQDAGGRPLARVYVDDVTFQVGRTGQPSSENRVRILCMEVVETGEHFFLESVRTRLAKARWDGGGRLDRSYWFEAFHSKVLGRLDAEGPNRYRLLTSEAAGLFLRCRPSLLQDFASRMATETTAARESARELG